MAEHYGVPVVLHSDHCSKKLLPWFDGMLDADEKHFKEHGTPLFSSHMLDLSEEPHEENIATCTKYLERMAKIQCLLEIEIGITGGEEDGVNNEDVKTEDLYSKPEEVMQVTMLINIYACALSLEIHHVMMTLDCSSSFNPYTRTP